MRKTGRILAALALILALLLGCAAAESALETAETQAGERLIVPVGEGWTLYMDEETLVEILREGRSTRVCLDHGAVLLDVARKLEEDETLQIEAGGVTASVRGTLLEVESHNPEVTKVVVYEGGADVNTKDGNTTHVPAGHVATVTMDTPARPGGAAEINVETRPITQGDASGSLMLAAETNPEIAKRMDEGTDGALGIANIVQEEAAELYPAEGDWTIDTAVTFAAGSATRIFNGSSLANPAVTADGLDSKYFIFSATAEGTQTLIGSGENPVTAYAILNSHGENVTSHFTNIQTVSGTLTVTGPAITITAASLEKVYNGTPLEASGAEASGLPAGYTCTATVTGSQTAVGEAESVVSGYKIQDSDENDVTGYFGSVTLTKGKLTVKPLSVIVSCGGGTVDYNGMPWRGIPALSYGNGEHQGETVTGSYVAGNTWRFTLFNGNVQEVSITGAGTDADSYTLTAKATLTNENVTCTFTDTALTIRPVPLTITTGSAEKEYDGEPLTCGTVTVDGLQGGDKITVTATGEQTEAGESQNTYTIDWGETKPGNYTVTDTLGTLTVKAASATPTPTPTPTPEPTPAPTAVPAISLTAPSAEKVYDGTPLTAGEVAVSGLPDGFTCTAAASGSQTDAGESENAVSAYTITDAEGNDVTEAFTNVTKTAGTLKVTPAALTVTTGSAEKVYDGTALTKDEASITGLVNGETATATVTGTQTETGKSDNTYTITWGTAKEGNYTITAENLGTLEVTPAALTVTTGSATKVYDGTALTKDEASITGLAVGETATATVTGTQTEAGKSDNTYTITWGTAKESNYTITEENLGTLKVTPAALTVTTGKSTKVYDGTALTKDEASLTGLVDGETATVAATGTQTEVGESKNTYTITWGTAKESNYEVAEELGALEVTAIPIVIDLGGGTRPYGYIEQLDPRLTCNGAAVALSVNDQGGPYTASCTLPDGTITVELSVATEFNYDCEPGDYTLNATVTISDTEHYTYSCTNTCITVEAPQEMQTGDLGD